MQTMKFRVKGADVQQLLSGAGTKATVSLLANLLIACHGKELSGMIARELIAKSVKLPSEAGEQWPGYDLGLDLKISIPSLGWMPPVETERRIPRYEDQSGVVVPQTEG